MKINLLKEDVVELAIKHFGEQDAKVYEKMFEYMEKIAVEFEATACLEVCTEYFVRFLSDVGRDYFYNHVSRIHEQSTVVPGLSKKMAFENELKARIADTVEQREQLVVETQATIRLYSERQRIAKAGIEELAAMVASSNKAREHLESILREIVEAGNTSLAQTAELISQGDLEGARKARAASDELIAKLEVDFAAQQDIVNAKELAYKAKDAELRVLLARTILE